VLLPQKAYPADVDILPASLRNLDFPLDCDGLLHYVGLPAILKPYSGGGWKHVYKVENREELIAAYDGTAPYAMTLQQFVRFDQYVRCFTFGKNDIVPVAYDPHQRKYIVDHKYLSPTLGDRIVKDARTINQALGYEMNTIEFGVEDGFPTRSISEPRPTSSATASRHCFDLVLDGCRSWSSIAPNGPPANPWPQGTDARLGQRRPFVGQPR
jgi:hypothetical protein